MAEDRLGRVAAVHPEDHSVDLVMTDDGSHVAGVQVLSLNGSTKTGLADLPVPAMPASGNVWDLTQQTDQDVLAVVGRIGSRSFVRGFLLPQICQMTFAKPGRRVNRHGSDVYELIEPNGDYEHYHPSGTYLRIAASPAHEDLTGQDFDGQWKITNNTTAAVHWHLAVGNAGTQVASIDIDPSGNIAVQGNGNLTVNVTGTASVTSTGAATVTAPSVTLDAAQTTCTGDLTVDGVMQVRGAGASGATSVITGTLTATGNLTAGAGTAGQVDVLGHYHPNGTPNTGAPVAGS